MLTSKVVKSSCQRQSFVVKHDFHGSPYKILYLSSSPLGSGSIFRNQIPKMGPETQGRELPNGSKCPGPIFEGFYKIICPQWETELLLLWVMPNPCQSIEPLNHGDHWMLIANFDLEIRENVNLRILEELHFISENGDIENPKESSNFNLSCEVHLTSRNPNELITMWEKGIVALTRRTIFFITQK